MSNEVLPVSDNLALKEFQASKGITKCSSCHEVSDRHPQGPAGPPVTAMSLCGRVGHLDMHHGQQEEAGAAERRQEVGHNQVVACEGEAARVDNMVVGERERVVHVVVDATLACKQILPE